MTITTQAAREMAAALTSISELSETKLSVAVFSGSPKNPAPPA